MKKIILPFVLLLGSFSLFAQTAGTLTVSFTTVASPVASYGTRSVDASWVESGDVAATTVGTWVKTLLGSTSGTTVKRDLYYWKVATSTTYNIVDATTSATRTSYGTRTCSWNGTNAATPRVLQADGVYTVKMEMTDDDTNYPSPDGFVVGYKFTKGATSSTGVLSTGSITVPEIINISVQWTPATGTGINNVEMDNYYTLYPTQAVSSIYVSGLGIDGIDICTLSAKIIKHSNIQTVNVSDLPKGAYLAVVYTKSGSMVVKKFQKL